MALPHRKESTGEEGAQEAVKTGGRLSGRDGWISDLPLSDGKLLHQPFEFLNEATVKIMIAVAVMLSVSVANPAEAGEIVGPGRFCGYSPIIDLRDGEKVTTLEGGIHGGSFRWEGAFGTLEVHGIGWASRPKGRIVKALSSSLDSVPWYGPYMGGIGSIAKDAS